MQESTGPDVSKCSAVKVGEKTVTECLSYNTELSAASERPVYRISDNRRQA